MNYRSALIYGVPTVVPPEEKERAFRVVSERLMPGRSKEVRPTTRRELAATIVLRIPLTVDGGRNGAPPLVRRR